MITKFAIFSPAYGLRQDYPTILIDKAFTPDNENIRIKDGAIESAKMRLQEFAGYKYTVGTLTATSGSANLTGAGTAWHSGFVGKTITIESNNYTISSVSTTNAAVLTANYSGAGGSGLSYSISIDQVSTPDGNPIIKYLEIINASSLKYLLAFTKTHIYRWDSSVYRWVQMFEGSECTNWSAVNYNNGVIATNNVDKPLWWQGDTNYNFGYDFDINTSGSYAYVVGTSVYISRAECVVAYENYAIFGNLALSNGENYPDYIYWSDLADQTVWNSGDAGFAYVAGTGAIKGFGKKQDFLFVFKENSVRKFWFTGSDTIFNNANHLEIIGCIAPDSIIFDDKGFLYYYASDMTIREIDLGVISYPVANTVVNINPDKDYIKNIRGLYCQEYNELWWAVPYLESQTNDIVLIFSVKDNTWTKRSMPVYAFGTYSRYETWTWDTLPFASWDEWAWPKWDYVAGSKGFATDICSDGTGKSFACHLSTKDNGSEFTSYFVLTTDLADLAALNLYKRMLFMYPYVKAKTSGTIYAEIKREQETNWKPAGSMVMSANGELKIGKIPIDFRARHFLIKFYSTSPFEFIGVVFDYEPLGDR